MKKIDYFPYFAFFNNSFIRLLRICVLLSLTGLLFYFSHQVGILKILLCIYTIYIVNEIFIHFKISKTFPPQTIRSDVSPEKTILFPTKVKLGSGDMSSSIGSLLSFEEIAFFTDKMAGYTFKKIKVEKEELLKKATDMARLCNGVYLYAPDLFAAYLLLSEPQTHILQEKELTENDILEVLLWTREKFNKDLPTDFKLHFTGFGVFDFFIYGWNTQLKTYSFDLTYSVIGKNATPIIGREKEFGQMLGMLSKNSTNNVLIIGEPGVGKSSLVSRLALEAYRNTRFPLHNVLVYELLVDRLLAGVNSAGDLGVRLGELLAEIEHIGNVILFIQNLENIFGAGGFGFDMSGVLFSYLKNGNIQIIGTTTPSLYKSVIEKKSSIMNLFETIRLEEPDRKVLLQMIAAHVASIEAEYHVSVSYKAVHETIELATTFLPETYLPGKAITLLQDVSSQVRLEGRNLVDAGDVTKYVQGKTNIILEKPTIDEKKVLLSLESDLHKRVIGQDEAVTAVSRAIRRLRSGFSQHKRPISVFLFLGPTGVGKTETAKALASLYFGDEASMIRLDMSEYQTQNEVERLLGGIPGGEEIESSLPDQVRLHPFSLVLLDEFEKAHPHILDIFLQVFEDGRLTDNQGKTVSFKNTIIIATSNAGSERIREMINGGTNMMDMKNTLVEDLLRSGEFKPELINRFDDVIVFKPLTVSEAGEIAKLILKESLATLEEDQIFISFDDKVIEKIVKDSFDQEAGARNMRRFIGASVEDFISRLILEDKLTKGSHVTLSVDTNGDFMLQ